MKQYSRVCERVDLDAIFYNFQMMKANIKDGVQMIAVTKQMDTDMVQSRLARYWNR